MLIPCLVEGGSGSATGSSGSSSSMSGTNSKVSISGTSDTQWVRNWNRHFGRFLHGCDCGVRVSRFKKDGWQLAVNAKLRAVPGSTFMFGRHVIPPSSSVVETVAIIRALDAMPQMMTMDMAPRTSDGSISYSFVRKYLLLVRGTAALVSERT